MGKWESSILTKFVFLLSFATVSFANTNSGLRAFYLVQQWLGSYCNQRGTKCCYPPTGKPSPDFTIYGLWPYYNDGSFPYNCGDDNYDVGRIKFLETRLRKEWPSFTCPQIGRKFWVHEWNKHGTCSKSTLGEIPYFQAALNLKKRANVFQALARAGIKPNNRFYSLKSIKGRSLDLSGFTLGLNATITLKVKAKFGKLHFVRIDLEGNSSIALTFLEDEEVVPLKSNSHRFTKLRVLINPIKLSYF